MYLLHQKGEQHTLWTMQVIIPKSARVILRAQQEPPLLVLQEMFWFLRGFALAVPGAEQVPQHSGACFTSSGWAQSLSSAVQGRCHTRGTGRVRPTRACTMCSHHTCNHQVLCATITQLSWLGNTAAGLTGIPRLLPVAALRGQSFRAQETTASCQFHGLSPKAALLVSSAGLDVTKQQHLNSPLCLFVISKEIPSCSQRANVAWNAENPSKACLGWHSCKHGQHLQFSDSWLLLEVAMFC